MFPQTHIHSRSTVSSRGEDETLKATKPFSHVLEKLLPISFYNSALQVLVILRYTRVHSFLPLEDRGYEQWLLIANLISSALHCLREL